MLKQYRMVIIGLLFMLTAIAATTLISLENGKPTEDTKVKTASLETEKDPLPEMFQNSPALTLASNDWQSVTSARAGGMVLAGQAETAHAAEEEGETQPETTETEGQEETQETEEISAETETEPETETEGSRFDGYVLPVVDVYLNIRDTPSTDGAIVGKLYVGSMAEIVEQADGWTRIHSGTVDGYVNNDYIVTGKEAEQKALEDGRLTGTVTEGGLRVRENPSTDADVLNIVGEGDTFDVVEEIEGWVAIEYSSDTVAYLAGDYVNVEFELGEAVSIEEELEAIRLAEEAAAKKAAEEAAAIAEAKAKAEERLAASTAIDTIQGDSYDASYDDTYLLASLVHMESGNEPYEGKLAVANVVLNRLKSGYGSNISEVIYAKGQFSGANTGALASRLAKGPNDESMRAAAEALSGVNNIGDYRNFISLGRANFGVYSEYTVIGNHCFYKR